MSLTKIRDIPIDKIQPSPFQTRIDFGDIESLAKNIKVHGLQNPITVRKLPKRKYELVSGARRLEAVRILGWERITASIIDVSDTEAAILCISENLQRENLNPIEEARGYQMLRDKFDLTHEKIAELAGTSRSYITNSLGLLKIDPFLQACLICGKLSISHIRIINTAPKDIPKYRLADIVMDWRLNVKELENIVTKLRKKVKILLWTRDIPIEHIKIPLQAFTSDDSARGVVIIDTTMALIGGLDILLKARKNGERTIEAEVVYFADLLYPSQSWTSIEPTKTESASSKPSGQFSRILSELIGDLDEMYKKYPVHRVIRNEDYLVFVPSAR
jgi:ParB/RepB/Spo0J family partition protein